MYRETRVSSVISQACGKIENTLAAKQALFFHAGLFVIALLIGIARYGHAMPPRLTTLVTLWSVSLLIHGALIYKVRSSATTQADQRDGLLNTVLVSVTVNGLLWAMWTLATDAQDSTPWHLGVALALITLGIVGLIAGKRALYNHWLNEYIRDSGETKRKRERLTQLNADGELMDIWLDDRGDDRLSSDAYQKNV